MNCPAWALALPLIAALAACTAPQKGTAPAASAARSGNVNVVNTPNGPMLGVMEVQEAQALLERLGYSISTIDGVVGPESRAAAVMYRQDQGAGASGAYDAELLSMLRRTAQQKGVATIAAPPPLGG